MSEDLGPMNSPAIHWADSALAARLVGARTSSARDQPAFDIPAVLTPQGMTDALRRCGATEAAVVDVRVSPLRTSQMAERFLLQLSYVTAAGRVGPEFVVAKLASASLGMRRFATAIGVYRREVGFYRDLVPGLDVRAPRVYAAVYEGDEFAVLLEDLSTGRRISVDAGCRPADAIWAVEQAAALHGSSWRGVPAHRPGWLTGFPAWQALGRRVEAVLPAFRARFDHLIGIEDVRTLAQLPAAIGPWLDTLRDDRCLWHGGFGADNLLFDALGGAVPVAVIEWQGVSLGPGVIDVSYFLGTALDSSSRRGWEDDLVRHHHDLLRQRGVSDYRWEQCWREYRTHSVYGLLLTISLAMGVESSERGDARFAELTRRAVTQIQDLDTLRLLTR